MKVAICFYGQPRRYKQVLNQWNKIISELDADVFIHTWYGQDRGRVDININELISDFSPKEIHTSFPHKFINTIRNDAKYETESYHAMNQSYSMNKSIQLILNYSKDLKKEYDIVIRCRFDITLLDLNLFIEFIKNKTAQDKLSVAANHWKGSDMFDDNIIIGNIKLLEKISTGYFNYTIDSINKTGKIPSGEQNLFRYISSMNMLDLISRSDSLNFLLIPLPLNEIIINQNEK